MTTWKLKENDAQKVASISSHFGYSKSISEILVGRKCDTPEKVEKFLKISLDQLGSPFDMRGMDDACERICKAIKEQQKIIIHGDFDADGITSSALLTLFLREIGCEVETFIPNRLEEGHGISQRFIQLASEKNAKLVITCDCGSSNEKEIIQMHDLGIDTIVTDHHHVQRPLERGILINPKSEHENEQPEELSGVGVVFMVLMALRKKLRDQGYFASIPEPNLKKYLDIVALGTIADMAPLTGFNRVLVIKGLEELQKTTRPGLLAMKEKTGIHMNTQMQSYDVGFRLAPRINAAARLGFAMEAFEMLVSTQPLTILHLSSKMEEWNGQRKKIQSKMFDQCQKEMQRQIDSHHVLVFASNEFHPGIIGLTAQKICAETGKPSFVFRVDGDIAKGSARCREPYHLVELMDSVKDLLEEYGGHREAGGCKMPAKHLQEFTKRIQILAAQQRSGAQEDHRWVDSMVDIEELSLEFFKQLYQIGPFGPGNPEPLFMSQTMVVGQPREVGDGHLQATIRTPSGKNLSCIAFGKWNAWKDTFQGDVSIYFHIQENVWNGRSSLSLQVQGFSNRG